MKQLKFYDVVNVMWPSTLKKQIGAAKILRWSNKKSFELLYLRLFHCFISLQNCIFIQYLNHDISKVSIWFSNDLKFSKLCSRYKVGAWKMTRERIFFRIWFLFCFLFLILFAFDKLHCTQRIYARYQFNFTHEINTTRSSVLPSFPSISMLELREKISTFSLI